jgi:hypothetical protein
MINATTHQDRFARTGIVRNERDKAEARRNRRKSGRPTSPADVREWEINRVIDHVFGASLPDDDDGREVLYELLNLATSDRGRIRCVGARQVLETMEGEMR